MLNGYHLTIIYKKNNKEKFSNKNYFRAEIKHHKPRAIVLVCDATGEVTVWEERTSTTDLNNGLATKEDNLGNPDVDGKVVASTAAGVRSWIKAASAWLDLEDTPNSYAGNAGRLVSVTGSEDSLELVDYSTALFIGTTPKASPVAGALWLNSNDGQIYTWYTSPIGGNSQWIKDNVGAI